MNIETLATRVEKRINAAFVVADSQLAQIKPAHISKSMSLGQMLMAASTMQDPDHVAYEIGDRLTKSIDRAAQILYAAKSEINDLHHAAAYLRGDGSAIHAIKSEAIEAAARTLKLGHEAGITNAHAAANKVEKHLESALERLAELEFKFIGKSRSAAAIVKARAAWICAHKSDHDRTKHYATRLERLKIAHRLKFVKGTK